MNDISNNHYPVLLSGNSAAGEGHEWVCDGYFFNSYTYTSSCNPGHVYQDDPGNFMFHMNWGWHEMYVFNDYNGWYSVDNWTSANGDFQFSAAMTTNIHL